MDDPLFESAVRFKSLNVMGLRGGVATRLGIPVLFNQYWTVQPLRLPLSKPPLVKPTEPADASAGTNAAITKNLAAAGKPFRRRQGCSLMLEVRFDQSRRIHRHELSAARSLFLSREITKYSNLLCVGACSAALVPVHDRLRHFPCVQDRAARQPPAARFCLERGLRRPAGTLRVRGPAEPPPI